MMATKGTRHKALWLTGALTVSVLALGFLISNVVVEKIVHDSGEESTTSKNGTRGGQQAKQGRKVPLEPITTLSRPAKRSPGDIRVHGVAVDRNGSPLDDCLITIGLLGQQWVKAFEIEPDGSFDGFGPPGKCRVAVLRKWPSTSAGPRADIFHSEVVRLEGNEIKLDIRSDKSYDDFPVPTR